MTTERERFEAWAQSQGLNTMMGFGNYYLADTAAAWKAWQAACPEGWQVVPKEPTFEMIAALGWGGDETLALGHGALSNEIENAYRAMLKSAPQPGEES